MKKQVNIKVVLVLFLALMTWTCTKNFEDINTDPNQPTEVPVTNHFGGVLQRFNNGFMTPSVVPHHANYIGSRLAIGNLTYTGTSEDWSGYYNALKNINMIIEDAEAAGNTNMLAVSLTLRAQMTQVATDRWRDMPYKEAAKAGEGIIAPKYDKQEDIYKEIIADLKKAADLFKAGGSDDLGEGDILLGGDISKWQKFCNSLRLRVAVRISGVDQGTATAIITEVLSNPGSYPVLASNDDNVEMHWPGTAPWEEAFWYWWYCCFHEGAGKIIVDIMNPLNDPRREVWFVPATTDGQFRGSERWGFVAPDVREDISNFNEAWVNGTSGPDGWFRYSEVCFLKAEIALKAGSPGDVKTQYEKGVRASLEQYGVAEEDITAYMAQDGVMLKGNADDFKKIITQKYIGNFLMNNEGWAEARRTDIPLLPNATNSAYPDHNRTAFRVPYPTSESGLNSTNYNEFAGNVVDYYWGQRMWWDTRTGVN